MTKEETYIIHNRIDSCCQLNLKASGISPLRLIRWLNNFEKEDWHNALTIAENVTYISEQDIYAQYDTLIKRLFNTISKAQNIFFIPSKAQDITTGSGKSAQMMLYYLEKVIDSLPSDKKRRISIIPNSRQGKNRKRDLNNNSVLVIFDDYIGSGKQIEGFVKNIVLGQHGQYYSNIGTLVFMSLFISQNGYTHLGKAFPNWEVISQQRNKVFSRRGSIFGYEKKMKPIREFCHKYGKQFYVWNKPKTEKVSIPLGYNNSQELLSFCYRTPNNTLPIIWNSGNNWYPLFPRFANDIISNGKEFRKESSFLLHKAKLLFNKKSVFITGVADKGEKLNNIITKDDVLILCIIRLKNKAASVPTICQKLDLRSFDYQDLIDSGIERGLFNKDESISEFGNTEYLKIINLRDKYDYEDYWKDNFEDPDEVFYLPKKFNGRT